MTLRDKFEAWAVSPESWCAGIERHGDSYKAVVTAASWEAFKFARKQALQEAYDAMFDVKGDKATRFDAQTAIRRLNEEQPS